MIPHVKRLIALTQCFQCGSWICIEKILDKLADHGYIIIVIGLGEIQRRNSKFKYCAIPYPAFNKYGDITCRSPLFNIIWNLPLMVTGAVLSLIQRPKAVIYNGLATGLTMPPFTRLCGSLNIVMYHSFIGNAEGGLKRLLHFLSKFVDMVVVNSRGSYRDISTVVDTEKIVINEHYADELFFRTRSQNERRVEALVISYVGRIDKDKLCFPLIEAAKKLGGNNQFQFNFAGAGSDLARVKLLSEEFSNIKYLGYVNDREELKKIYQNSDVLWAFADETYLGMPAVEALACGTPIIIPIYAAIKGIKKQIDKLLVPGNVGWLVNTDDIEEIVTLLTQIQQSGISSIMKENCIAYAKKKYSSNNIENTVSKIIALLNKDVR